MHKASEYFKNIRIILSTSLRTAISFTSIMGIVYGSGILCELIFTKSSRQMTVELSILAWGAVILFTGFVGSFIVYTIHFLITGRLSLTERNGKSETEKAIGEQVKPVKRQVALLKRRVKILEVGGHDD